MWIKNKGCAFHLKFQSLLKKMKQKIHFKKNKFSCNKISTGSKIFG